MKFKDEALYLSTEGVESISPRDEGRSCVRYLDMRERVVDGTPDEVFKALLNPPETVLKADVEDVLQRLEHGFTDRWQARHHTDPRDLAREARRALGLESKR
jgi:hypothetical protein